jgi:hypothetical protein
MKGITENDESDFYGVIDNIIEISYNYLDYKKAVVLFYCNWYDTNALTTIIHQNYQQPWLTWGEIKAAKIGDVPVWRRFFNAFKVSYSFIVKVELILVD